MEASHENLPKRSSGLHSMMHSDETYFVEFTMDDNRFKEVLTDKEITDIATDFEMCKLPRTKFGAVWISAENHIVMTHR